MQTGLRPAVLWRDPGRVAAKDFRYGVGGRALAPVAPFRFLKEDLTGSNPKIEVTDARGRKWSVKWSDEAKPEVFASRLAWACGFIAQPEYFVAEGRILAVGALKRAKNNVMPDGTFRDARFQLRSKFPEFLKSANWTWNDNPFVGEHPLQGLKVLIMLLSNWDNKDARDIDRDSNVAVFRAGTKTNPIYEYFVADWGASLGKWGHVYDRSKWDCAGFQKQTPDFVKGVKDGYVRFGYVGQHTQDAARGIRVSDVQWLLRYLGQVTDRQLQAGLEASGATHAETGCYAGALRLRIDELRSVAGR